MSVKEGVTTQDIQADLIGVDCFWYNALLTKAIFTDMSYSKIFLFLDGLFLLHSSPVTWQ